MLWENSHNYEHRYEVRDEDRDEDGNITGSYCEYETDDYEDALREARKLKETSENIVIEEWDGDELIDTILDI